MHTFLDLERFPIDRPDSVEYQALARRCRAELVADGMFSLTGFMRPGVAQQVVSDTAHAMQTEAFHHARDHNIYFAKSVPDLAPDHPALKRFRTSNYTLCADQVDQTAVMDVYTYAPLRQFLADVMGKPKLHLMADPLARVNVMSYGPQDQLNWHFDRSEFTVTLLLQAPEIGGEFEYRTDLRSEDDPNLTA